MIMTRPRRSVLYMPAINARAVAKARELPVDAVALDLEDSIAPERKDEARAAALTEIGNGGFGSRELVIRLNGPTTPWFEADLAAAVTAAPDAILVPKIEEPDQLRMIGDRLTQLQAPEKTRLWIMMETPLAILNAHAIAQCSKLWPQCRLSCFALGNNDIQKETRAIEHPERLPLLMALQTAVFAARAYRLGILDGVYNNFRDLEGFRRECEQGRLFGMDGKTLIHPGQIDIANEVYGPPASEVAWARKIIAAFEEPANRGKGAIPLDGQMVELLHLEIAQRTVAMVERIMAESKTGG